MQGYIGPFWSGAPTTGEWVDPTGYSLTATDTSLSEAKGVPSLASPPSPNPHTHSETETQHRECVLETHVVSFNGVNVKTGHAYLTPHD